MTAETYHGKPCCNCGNTERYKSNWHCVSCSKRHHYRLPTEKRREYLRRYRRENPTKTKKWRRKGYVKNSKKIEAYRQENREVLRERVMRSQRKRPWVHAANQKLREARKVKACPWWVDTEELKKIYQACPKGYHVDHIVPLKGENVCGLHVPWNLQHLPALENIRKGNRLMEETYGQP